LRSEPATFKERAEANVTFFATLVAYMDAVVTWIGTKVTEITAIAMAGDLPELTGKAGTVLQVNGADDGLGFLDTGTTGRAVLASESEATGQSALGLGDVALLNFADLINTDGEWEAGVATDYGFLTPAQLALAVTALSPVKAWVNFNGTGTVAIRSSKGVSSITDLGPGSYQVNRASSAASTDYTVVASCSSDSGACFATLHTINGNSFTPRPPTVDDFVIAVTNRTNVATDALYVSAAILE
jgi:hypothetical protein